jgi:hypothetical protein
MFGNKLGKGGYGEVWRVTVNFIEKDNEKKTDTEDNERPRLCV